MVIKRLPGPLVIDGDMQKWRKLGFPPQILLTPQNSYGKIDGPLDLSGVIRLGYHGRDLYAAVIVFDDVVSFHQPASRFYQGDSLQFCINGFLTGFGFSVAQTIDQGAFFLRNRFFYQNMDLNLDPAKAPRVIKKFANAADIPERQYIESIYGVDLSKSPGYVVEFQAAAGREYLQGRREDHADGGPRQVGLVGLHAQRQRHARHRRAELHFLAGDVRYVQPGGIGGQGVFRVAQASSLS